MKVKPIISLITIVGFLLIPQLSQAQQSSLTWKSFRSLPATQKPDYIDFSPQEFPKGFANGQLALTRQHTGSSAYIVAREGVRLPSLSTVRQQISKNISFNAADVRSSFPALADFPKGLYNTSQAIEVIHWAARYDDQALRNQAKASRRDILSNRRVAYYIEQDTGRKGWCTFAAESAKYSDFLCVNIANSPQTALAILNSIINRHPGFHK